MKKKKLNEVANTTILYYLIKMRILLSRKGYVITGLCGLINDAVAGGHDAEYTDKQKLISLNTRRFIYEHRLLACCKYKADANSEYWYWWQPRLKSHRKKFLNHLIWIKFVETITFK